VVHGSVVVTERHAGARNYVKARTTKDGKKSKPQTFESFG